MKTPRYSVEVIYEPSGHLAEQVKKLGLPDKTALMRDYLSVPERDPSGFIVPDRSGRFAVTVGDMANNIKGTEVNDPGLVQKLGLPEDYRLNGGLYASHKLRRWFGLQEATGVGLVEQANKYVKELYKNLGMTALTDADPGARFTGYFAHARFGSDPNGDVILTGVGDVMVYVNGERVPVGAEKEIDTLKERLVKELTEIVWSSPVGDVERVIEEFVCETGLDSKTTEELKARIFSAKNSSHAVDRQAIYRSVDDIVTPWHINTLQNPIEGRDKLSYGAVDGTHTPEWAVKEHTVPVGELETLVMATDGLEPTSESVRSPEDLKPVNPTYGEQTAVGVRRVE